MFDLTTLELMTREKVRECRAELERDHIAASVAAERGGVRRAVATALVRWGMRLDRAAGEQQREFAHARAATEGRR